MKRKGKVGLKWGVMFVLLFQTFYSFCQVIFSNPITGSNPNTANPYTTGQTIVSGITASGIGRGAGITGRNSTNSYNARDWTTAITPDLTDFFQWTITPNTCSKIDFQSLALQIQIANGNSPSRVQLRSSVDNYTSVIKIDSFTTAGAKDLLYDLSSYTNVTQAITFRFYGYRAFTSSGELAVNSFTFNGSVLSTVVANAGPDQTICLGNSATLIASGGNSYSWSTGQNSSSVSVSPTTSTTYTVTATVGSCTATDQVLVTTTTPSIPYSLGTNSYYIWRGGNSGDFNVSSNWYRYNSGSYSVSNNFPNSSSDVIISSGTCVSNALVISSNVQVDSLILLNGASLSFSGQGQLIANNDVIVNNGATLDLGQSSSAVLEVKDGNLKLLGNSIFNPGNGTVKFHNSLIQPESHTLICESNSNNTFYNLDFHGDNDPSIQDFRLGSNIKVTGQLKVTTNNFKLNGFNVDLGSTGTISEGNNNKKIYDIGNGYISAVRNIVADGNTYNLGNLGLSIKPASGKPLGTTLVKRYHTSISYDLDGLFNAAISRYYSVTPQFNGGTTYADGLGATVSFNYATVPLSVDDMANEMNFTMYRKGQGETSWQKLEGGVLNMSSKTYTYTNFPRFSDVTLGGSGVLLPVELLSFTGECLEDKIALKWETASEFNSAYFDVEKSRDGENWEVISTIPAAGISNEKLTYSTVDFNVWSDYNYYRLNQVDVDGTTKKYDVIQVNCLEATKGYLTTYPNPSGNSLQVVLNDKDLIGLGTLNIFDSKGKIIYRREVTIEDGINMFMINEQLTSGIYFVNISAGNKSTSLIRHCVK